MSGWACRGRGGGRSAEAAARAPSPPAVISIDSDDDEKAPPAAAPAPAPPAVSPQQQSPAGHAAAQQHQAAGAVDEEDQASLCVICLDMMSEEGGHRPAALKCGHVMGSRCIQMWLATKKRCPQCNAPAKKKDVTMLYNLPKKVAAGTGSSAAALEHELQAARTQAEQEHARAKALERRLQLLQQQLEQQQYQQLQQRLPHGRCQPDTSSVLALDLQLHQHNQHLQQQNAALIQCAELSQALAAHSQVFVGFPGQPLQQQAARAPGSTHHHLSGSKRPLEDGSTAAGAAAAATRGSSRRPTGPAAAAAAAALARASCASAAPAGDGPHLSHGSRRQLVLAQVMPVLPPGAGMQGSHVLHDHQGGWRMRANGGFQPLQVFEVACSRAFAMNAQAGQLVVAETPSAAGAPRLRRISMYTPSQSSFQQLPLNSGVVRCLAAQQPDGTGSSGGGGCYLAVVASQSGLLVCRPDTNNVVHTIRAPSGQVWSAAWSSSNAQQLYLGLDRGRMALADLRMASGSGSKLVSVTGNAGSSSSSTALSQPFHTVAVLPSGWWASQQQQQKDGPNDERDAAAEASQDPLPEPEAVVACAGGVYAWSSQQPNHLAPLLLSSSYGGTCESICLHPAEPSIVASFRARMGEPVVAAHIKLALTSAPAPGSHEHAQQHEQQHQRQLAESLKMLGHSSTVSMTHGCFVPTPHLASEPWLFASGDEACCEPRVWGSASGAMLMPSQPWQRHKSPVLQLDGGMFNSSQPLLAALSDSELVVNQWTDA